MPGLFIAVSSAIFILPCVSDGVNNSVVEALRTIIFGTHSRIGLDFGILFAWVAVSFALFPFATRIMLWKMKRGL